MSIVFLGWRLIDCFGWYLKVKKGVGSRDLFLNGFDFIYCIEKFKVGE